MEENENQLVKLAVIQNDISYIKKEVDDIKVLVSEQYVTKSEFEPIKRIVYGMVSVILMAVVAAVLAIIIRK
jgi:hypothetical protein